MQILKKNSLRNLYVLKKFEVFKYEISLKIPQLFTKSNLKY